MGCRWLQVFVCVYGRLRRLQEVTGLRGYGWLFVVTSGHGWLHVFMSGYGWLRVVKGRLGVFTCG